MQLVSHISLFDVKWFKYIYKTKTSYLPHPHIPYILHIYIYNWLLNLINNLLVLFRKASLSLSNLLIPSSHLENFGLVFVPNKLTFSRIIMIMCQTGSVQYHVCWCGVSIAGRQAGPAATEWVEDISHQTSRHSHPPVRLTEMISQNMH